MVKDVCSCLSKQIVLQLKNPGSSFRLRLISSWISSIIGAAMDRDFAQSAIDVGAPHPERLSYSQPKIQQPSHQQSVTMTSMLIAPWVIGARRVCHSQKF